jgi:hypothetical protein
MQAVGIWGTYIELISYGRAAFLVLGKPEPVFFICM